MTAELLREEGTELLAAAVAGSSGNIEYNGEIVKTKEQWVELLSDSSLEWLRDQINTAQNDLSNFYRNKTKTNSSCTSTGMVSIMSS